MHIEDIYTELRGNKKKIFECVHVCTSTCTCICMYVKIMLARLQSIYLFVCISVLKVCL